NAEVLSNRLRETQGIHTKMQRLYGELKEVVAQKRSTIRRAALASRQEKGKRSPKTATADNSSASKVNLDLESLKRLVPAERIKLFAAADLSNLLELSNDFKSKIASLSSEVSLVRRKIAHNRFRLEEISEILERDKLVLHQILQPFR